MMKKALICVAMLSLVVFNCTKKTITNNYYPSADKGAIVGFVYPPDSETKVTAYLGMEIASTYIDTTGYFELNDLPLGYYALLVQAEGYFDYYTKGYSVLTGGATVSVDTIFLTSIHDLIQSVWPSDRVQGVRVTDRIRITFRTKMNQGSVEGAFHVEPKIEGDFSWNYGSRSALEFVPRDPFMTNTTYQVTVDTTASDADGIKLSKPYRFSFTTEPIRIVSTFPRHKETWVSPTTAVTITFNTSMNRESVISAFKMVDSQMKAIDGDYYWSTQQYLSFRPYSALTANEKYTVTIDTNASDISGGKLTELYQFYFTTEPIRILTTRPTNQETWVDPNTSVIITFNTEMNAESVILAFKMVDSQLKDVTGAFLWYDKRYVEFRSYSVLAFGETYTVTIDTNAKDISGGSLDKPYNFWFKTRPY